MSEESKIQWTDATWNPWHGCRKVSAGCKYCYMFRDKERYGQLGSVIKKSKTKFSEPLKWEDSKMIFTCSWSDFFIEEADSWREQAWEIIKNTPHHTYQILTKRPERIEDHLPSDWGNGYPNVWLGVSIEEDLYKGRLVTLGRLKTKSSVFKTFVSAEPLIGYLDLANDDISTSFYFNDLDWLIIGGESGNDFGKYRYRQCDQHWIYDLIHQAHQFNVPVFVKQLGTHLSKKLGLDDRHGGNIDEWDQVYRKREFPETVLI